VKSVGRALALMSAAFLQTGCVHPQTIGSYDELRSALKPGDRVEVTTSAGAASARSAVVSGDVEAVSADAVTIVSDGERRVISRPTIAQLDKMERTWRRGMLMGLAIGGGTSAAVAGFSDCGMGRTSCPGTRASGIAGGALIGIGIGAAVGAKPRTTLIYVRPDSGSRSGPAR